MHARGGSHALRDLALDHQRETPGSRAPPKEPVEDRARDVVRDVQATTSYGSGTRWTDRGSSASPSTSRAGLPACSSAGERLPAARQRVTQVQLHRGHLRGRREQPAGQEPETRPDLEDPAPGLGIRLGQDPLEDLHVREEVLGQVVARPQAGVAQSRAGRTRGSSAQVARARRSCAHRAQRQRRPRIEVQAGAHARGEPPGAGRADHRPVVRAQARPRDDHPDPARRGPADDRVPQRRVGGDAAAEHDPAGTDLLGRPDASSSPARPPPSPGSPRPARRRRRRSSGPPSRSSAGRPASARAWPTIRRAAVLRPEKLKGRRRESCRKARGTHKHAGLALFCATRSSAGPPGKPRPSRLATLSNASPAASSIVPPSSSAARGPGAAVQGACARPRPPAPLEGKRVDTVSHPAGWGELAGVEVAFEVVEGHQRQALRQGQGLGRGEVPPPATRPARGGWPRPRPSMPVERDLGRCAGRHRSPAAGSPQVGPRGDLGHDPAEPRVQLELRGHDVGVDPAPALDERDAVARRTMTRSRSGAGRSGALHRRGFGG